MDTLRTLLDVPDWKADAHCAGMNPSVFFPHPPTRPTGGALRRYEAEVAVAKAHCRRCDVQAECLAYALANREPFGVWGGMSVEERRRIEGQRKTRAAVAECGSLGGHGVHRRNNETPCRACRDAVNRYQSDRRRRLKDGAA